MAGPAAAVSRPVGPDDLAALMYTSGTTGLPKGAMHTHGTMLAQAASVVQIFRPEDLAAMLNHFPLYHNSGIAAPMIFLLNGWKAGADGQVSASRGAEADRGGANQLHVGAPVTVKMMLDMAAAEPVRSLVAACDWMGDRCARRS